VGGPIADFTGSPRPRGPHLWDDCDVLEADGFQIEPIVELAEQAAPDYEVDRQVRVRYWNCCG